jgi:uncharacterized protein
MTPLWELAAADARLWRSPLHGEHHANRVAETGVELARRTAGADPAVVFAFAVLHDCRRRSERRDPEHGPRAAVFAEQLHAAGDLALDADQLAQLLEALRRHDQPITARNEPTFGCCLDADRLQLQRLRIQPRPELLSTAAALELIEWSRKRLHVFTPWQDLADTLPIAAAS